MCFCNNRKASNINEIIVFFFGCFLIQCQMVRCWSSAICVSVLFFFFIQHNPLEINCLREIKCAKKKSLCMVEPRVVIMTMSMCWYNYSYTHITLWHVKKYPQLLFFLVFSVPCFGFFLAVFFFCCVLFTLVRGCVTDCNNFFLYSFCVQCINGILYNIVFNIY